MHSYTHKLQMVNKHIDVQSLTSSKVVLTPTVACISPEDNVAL